MTPHDHTHSHQHHSPSHDHGHSGSLGVASNKHQKQKNAEQAEVLRRLKRASLLCGSFLIVEIVGGYLSGSLAVLSDAAHLFADLAGFAVAIAASHLASLPTTDQHTFGLKRAESLAALLSMISLALVSIYLAVEALRRLYHYYVDISDHPVDGKLMSGVAVIGVLVNLALAAVLGVENHIHLPGADHDHSHDHGHGHSHGHSHGHAHAEPHQEEEKHHEEQDHDHGHSHEHHHHHHQEEKEEHHGHSHEHHHHHKETSNEASPLLLKKHEAVPVDELAPCEHVAEEAHEEGSLRNINLQAAYLHVLGDLLQSVGVLIAGLAIWYNPKWKLVDPICTLFFCAVVFYSTLGVLRHSVAVLLQEVPPELNWQRIYTAIDQVDGISNVHDLHVWSISHGQPALTVHCSCSANRDPATAMRQIAAKLKTQMGIDHVTIQVQQGEGACITCVANGGGCDVERISSHLNTTIQGDTSSGHGEVV